MRFVVRLVVAFAVLAGTASAQQVGLRRSSTPPERGRSGDEQRFVQEFERIFAPHLLPQELRGAAATPAKCATLLVLEYQQAKSGLSSATIRAIDGWLTPQVAVTSTYETAHFRFTYSVDGPDAVPSADVAPADGVPDFVAHLGTWGETAWASLVDDAGFRTPLRDAGRVDVAFRAMDAYGFTHLVGGVPSIVLNHDFAGFPPNDDPDGPAVGAAKVTIAHELKHATQYAGSQWTEGGWIEADAVWAEDYVFDGVNDYLQFLGEGSAITSPENWWPISYEDCLFSKCLSEQHGVSVLVDFFARRAAAPSEPVLASYDAALRGRGSSLSDAAATLGLWCAFTGMNAAGRPTGFAEADRYPSPAVSAVVVGTTSRQLAPLGTSYLLSTSAGRTGRPHVALAATGGAALALHAVTTDREGARAFLRIPVTGSGSAAAEIPHDWSDLATLVVCVTDVDPRILSGAYDLGVDSDGAVGTGLLESAQLFALHPNRPNPFRASTTLSFSLPAAATVRLAVYDAAGRLVRRLFEHESLGAGAHERVWDGRDEAGHVAAPGIYAYRLEADGRTATRKMLLLR
ncbi:MAG: FlgD immunoglobulin-like domain containing protein [bacterium]